MNYDYILKNWNKYGIPCTRDKFIVFLNILEANNENLDSFHDVCLNGLNNFCGIYGCFESDIDLFNCLFDFHIFIKHSELKNYINNELLYYLDVINDNNDLKFYTNMILDSLIKTHDGYIVQLEY